MLRRLLTAAWRTWRLKRDPVGWARSVGVRIGRDCRLLGLGVETFGSEPYLVELGDHVTVTSGVRFITHDGGVWVFRGAEPALDVFAPIRVGNNVFIGINAILMPGVTIGDDCVIGAGSVVTRGIPAGSVAAGAPARVIKSIAEYRAGVAGRESRIRGLSEPARRTALMERFPLGAGTADAPR